MNTDIEILENLIDKANMNMEVLAQHWNEDLTLVREYFHNFCDKYNTKPYADFIQELYTETEKEVELLKLT